MISHQEFIGRVYKINPQIQILSIYQGGAKPITFCCDCGKTYTFSQARALLMGQRCGYCKIRRVKESQLKSNEKFIEELAHKCPSIEPLESYKGSHYKIKYRCRNCGFEHQASPTNLLSNFGCPNCSSSKGEAAIREFLLKYGVVYEAEKSFEDCRDQLPLRFDFYIPEIRLLIEYQGEQHYKERFDWAVALSGTEAASFTTLQKHDNIKRQYCRDKGYEELKIKYTDLKNIEEILLKYLRERGVIKYES